MMLFPQQQSQISTVLCNNPDAPNFAHGMGLASSDSPRSCNCIADHSRLRNCPPAPACRRANVGRLSMHEACGLSLAGDLHGCCFSPALPGLASFVRTALT